MNAVTRRSLLSGFAASLSLPKLFAAFNRPLGVQTYTVRNLLPAKGEAAFQAIAQIGYKEVEISLPDAKKFAAVLKETGLKATGSHIDGTIKALEAARLDEAIGAAKELGVPAVGLAYVRPDERTDPAGFWQKFPDQLNEAGERCKKAGLTFFYHHHNFEFDPKANAIELLHKKLTKDVKLEIDCFWASVGGVDPAAMIEKWKGRIFALHLKDKAKGTPVSYETNLVKREEFLEVGSGVVDWTKVLKNAASAGVGHFYVEQDYTSGDPIESLKKSYAFLRTK
jgi:sugar phosphate isomerase/epimerase